MKKKSTILCLFICIAVFLQAQTKIAVYVSSVLPDEHNTLLADNLVEAFAESDKYIAVNRSRALYDLLKKAYQIQQDGHIDFAQVVNATKQFGETQLCAVSVIKINNTYVFRASILDVESNTVIKSTSHHCDSYSSSGLTFNEIYTASQKLVEGLLPGFKFAPEPTKKTQEEKPKTKRKGRCDIAWGIAGAGYPWSLATSFNFRYGGIAGIGLYADVGAAFTHISVESMTDGVANYSFTTLTKFHYAAGAKFYFYKGINIGCGYGSIHNPYSRVSYNYGYELDKDEAKTIRKQFNEQRHGLLIHAGYDFYSDFNFFFGFNGGVSYELDTKKFEPMFNFKIGVNFDN